MLGNPLALLGLANTAASTASAVADGVSSLVKGDQGSAIQGEGGGGSGLFSSLLTNAQNGSLQATSLESINQLLIPDAELTEQSLQALVNGVANGVVDAQKKSEAGEILDANSQSLISNTTSNYLGQIISNEASAGIINPEKQNLTEDTLPLASTLVATTINNLDALAQPTLKNVDDLAAYVKNPNFGLASSTADLSSIEKIPEETQQKITDNLISKNLTTKRDERILGQDNLESLVNDSKQNYLNKAVEILSNNSRNPFGLPDTAFVNDNRISDKGVIEGNNSLFRADSETLFGKNSDIGNKVIAKADDLFRTALSEAQYKVAHISKNKNVIDLHLEPAHLGKVQIKFDFGAEGRSHVTVVAENKDTLDILRKDSSQIEKILQDNGIKADSGSLSFNLQGGNNGSSGYEAAQDLWSKSSLFAFSLEQDINEAVANINVANAGAASSASLYGNYLARGMLNILV